MPGWARDTVNNNNKRGMEKEKRRRSCEGDDDCARGWGLVGWLGDKVNNNNDKLWTLSTLQGSSSSASGLVGLDVIIERF